MSGTFTMNGAKGKKADSKPYIYINNEMLATNLSSGSYTFVNLGYGENQVVNLKGGGIVKFIVYDDSRSEFTVPMSADMYTLAYCHELAQGPTFELKIMDTEMGVTAKIANCIASEPSDVSLGADSEMTLTFKGDPIQFIST